VRGELLIGFRWGDLREKDHLEDPDVDDIVILRWIFRKWYGVDGMDWTVPDCRTTKIRHTGHVTTHYMMYHPFDLYFSNTK
jgi:hypothetical protein